MRAERRVEYRGELLKTTELQRVTGFNYGTIDHYLRKGMSADAAVDYLKRKHQTYDVGGEMLTVEEIARRSGRVSVDKVWRRMEAGESPEEIIASYRATRMAWPDKAFALIYSADAKADMHFRRLSENNWGWTSDYFAYMVSKLGKRHVLLRAWRRESGEPAMLRLYLLAESEDKDDVLAEIVEQGQKAAMLRKWGLA
jgi:hypothetical protein